MWSTSTDFTTRSRGSRPLSPHQFWRGRSARRGASSDNAAIGKLAGVAFPIRQGALDHREHLTLRGRAVDQHSLEEAAFRSHHIAIEKDVELTKSAFLHVDLRPKATSQLIRELFGA